MRQAPFAPAVHAVASLSGAQSPSRRNRAKRFCASGLAAPLLFSPCTHYLSVLGFPDLRRPTWLHAPV